MKSLKMKAVLETCAVFVLVHLLFMAMQIPPFVAWKSQIEQRPFLEYAMVLAVPLLVLTLTRRRLAAFGIAIGNRRAQWEASCQSFWARAAWMKATSTARPSG